MSESEIIEIISYIKDQIPMKLDLRSNDLKYDTRNIYYKIYKYIQELREQTKEGK